MGYEDDYQDSFQTAPERNCDRCGASADDKTKPDPVCGEVQVAFGLVSWLCHDCRKDWHRMFKEHPMQSKYSQATLRLEFWKARVDANTNESEIEKGLILLTAVDQLELEINKIANTWLVAGLDEVRSL